jgi:hypothetical protein
MAACGVGGVSMRFLGCLAWGYGIISGRVGGCFLVISDLSWEMTPRSDCGLTCSVGIRPLRELFRICIVLLPLRMLS